MKYIIKSQVKPYTRTRKGKFERVSEYSRKGQPYDTRKKEYAQPKEGTIQKIGGTYKIARKVMVEVKKDKWLPEVQFVDPRPEDMPAINARAHEAAVNRVAKHEAEYKMFEQERKKKLVDYTITPHVTEKTKFQRIMGEPYSVKEHTEKEYKDYLSSLKEDEKELSLEQWKLRLALEEPEFKEDKKHGQPFLSRRQRKIHGGYTGRGGWTLDQFLANEEGKRRFKEKDQSKKILETLQPHTKEDINPKQHGGLIFAKEGSKYKSKLHQMLDRIGQPYEVEKPLRNIELEVKPGMKRTEEWKIKEALKENSSEKPPKVLNAKWKKDINKELHEISTTYHTDFPSDKIFESLRKRGVVVLQEDGTEFSGFFLGENAQTTFQLAPVGSKHTVSQGHSEWNYEAYTPFKNTALVMGWYKMPSGKYEMTTYVG